MKYTVANLAKIEISFHLMSEVMMTENSSIGKLSKKIV